jgi:hypothetical protein
MRRNAKAWAAVAALAVGSVTLSVAIAGCGPTGCTAAGGSLSAMLAGLTVAPEDMTAPYDRATWGGWTTVAGCDTRERVLIRDGGHVVTGPECSVTGGTWASPYDGLLITVPAALDIDHVVPLAQAERSGARDWTRARRAAFANDTSNLVAVSAHSNRSKGDRDPATWMPAAADCCAYATSYIETKAAYGLSVDPGEKAALTRVLTTCSTPSTSLRRVAWTGGL